VDRAISRADEGVDQPKGGAQTEEKLVRCCGEENCTWGKIHPGQRKHDIRRLVLWRPGHELKARTWFIMYN